MIPAHCFRLRQALEYALMSVFWGLIWTVSIAIGGNIRVALITGLIMAITFTPMFLAARWIIKR